MAGLIILMFTIIRVFTDFMVGLRVVFMIDAVPCTHLLPLCLSQSWCRPWCHLRPICQVHITIAIALLMILSLSLSLSLVLVLVLVLVRVHHTS